MKIRINSHEIMVNELKADHIRNIARVARLLNFIKRVVIFGSSVREDCREDSDIDVFVITDMNAQYAMRTLEDAVRKYDESQEYDFIYRKKFKNYLLDYNVNMNGVIIYDRDKDYEEFKGFKRIKSGIDRTTVMASLFCYRLIRDSKEEKDTINRIGCYHIEQFCEYLLKYQAYEIMCEEKVVDIDNMIYKHNLKDIIRISKQLGVKFIPYIINDNADEISKWYTELRYDDSFKIDNWIINRVDKNANRWLRELERSL